MRMLPRCQDEYGDLPEMVTVTVVTSSSSTLSKIRPDGLKVVAKDAKEYDQHATLDVHQVRKLVQMTNGAQKTIEPVKELEASSSPAASSTTAAAASTTPQPAEGEVATINTNVDNALGDESGVFVVHAVAALDSRRSVVLGVGGPQDGKVGNLDKESGGGLSDEAVPAWRGTRKRD